MSLTDRTRRMNLGFLALPRELRDAIYQYYVIEFDGYHYHYDSGKFRTADHQHIDLALMYTCTTVAKEMHHLALGSNILHFSTIETEPERALRYDGAVADVNSKRIDTLDMLCTPQFQHYVSAELVAKVSNRFPRLGSLFHEPFHHHRVFRPNFTYGPGRGSCWGEAKSTYRTLQHFILNLLASETDFIETLANYYEDHQRVRDEWVAERDEPIEWDSEISEEEEEVKEEEEEEEDNDEKEKEVEEESQEQVKEREAKAFQDRLQEELDKASVLRSPYLMSGAYPWSIPSDEELRQICTDVAVSNNFNHKMLTEIQWRFSAAAAAIHFFKSASQSIRQGARNVVLHEDKRSVANAECHISGLVPFCSQNPQLRIQRRVNVWRNFSEAEADSSVWEFADLIGEGADDRHNQTYGTSIGENYCKWITEAYAVYDNGMPAGSFSLVFDGEPALEQSSQLFEYVKTDAAWQIAQEKWFIDHKLNPGLEGSIKHAFHMSLIFPQAIEDMIEGTSFISCNFPTGGLPDPEPIIRKNRRIGVFTPTASGYGVGMPAHDYKEAYKDFSDSRAERNTIETLPPLPASLFNLWVEDVKREDLRQALINSSNLTLEERYYQFRAPC